MEIVKMEKSFPICHRCLLPCEDKSRCCRYVCHKYLCVSKKIVPNTEYVPVSSVIVPNVSEPYYCTFCDKGMITKRCSEHGENYEKYRKMYISPGVIREMTENRFTSRKYDYALKVCAAFEEGGFANIRKFVRRQVQKMIRVTDDTLVCPECCRFTNSTKCCRVYTKRIINGRLCPNMHVTFHDRLVSVKDKHEEYYCMKCLAHVKTETCKGCNGKSTHRWYDGERCRGYIPTKVCDDVLRVIDPDDEQKELMKNNYRYLVKHGRVPGIDASMLVEC